MNNPGDESDKAAKLIEYFEIHGKNAKPKLVVEQYEFLIAVEIINYLQKENNTLKTELAELAKGRE